MPLLEGSEENRCVPRELGTRVWQFSSACNLAELELECFLHWANFPCEHRYVNQAAFPLACLLWFYCISGRVLSVFIAFWSQHLWESRPLGLARSLIFVFCPLPGQKWHIGKPYCSLKTQSWNTIKKKKASCWRPACLFPTSSSPIRAVCHQRKWVLCAKSSVGKVTVDLPMKAAGPSGTTSSLPGLTWCLLASTAIYDSFLWPSWLEKITVGIYLPCMSHHTLNGSC